MPTVPPPWRAEKDPASGATYYWNTDTNETSWELPAGAKTGAADAAAPNRADGEDAAQGGENGARNGGGAYTSKDVYGAHTLAQAATDVKSWREKNEVFVSAGCPDPYLSFDEANLPPQLLAEIKRAGFPSPSPIQSQAWPVALGGRDLVGIAKTGSGKTLAFLMPAFMQIVTRRPDPRRGPFCLVLAPTRELATQILEECNKFGRNAGMSATCCYGGAPKGNQLRDLQRGVFVVIATPGRLNDFLEARQVNLGAVGYLVLDEVRPPRTNASMRSARRGLTRTGGPGKPNPRRQTACSTWALSRRFGASSRTSHANGRRSCSRPRGPWTSAAWRRNFSRNRIKSPSALAATSPRRTRTSRSSWSSHPPSTTRNAGSWTRS